MIECPQCGYENDPTRVFCHNCGIRLERADQQPSAATAGIAPATRSAEPSPQKKKPLPPQRPKTGTSSPGIFSAIFRLLLSTLILSALIACIVQMVRPLANLPRPLAPDESAAQAAYYNLKSGVENPTMQMWVSNPQTVNNYLAATLRPVAGSQGLIDVQFQRAFVVFGDGTFRLWLVQTYAGHPIYYAVDVAPVPQGGGMSARITGGQIGHLPIHPLIAPFMAKLYGPMLDSLNDPIGVLKKAQSAAINHNDVQVSWRAASAPPK